MELKNNARVENADATVDDLLPVIAELEHRVAALEAALREHEHLPSGKSVIRL